MYRNVKMNEVGKQTCATPTGDSMCECMSRAGSDGIYKTMNYGNKINQKSSSKVKALLGAGASGLETVVDEVLTPAFA